MQPRRVFGLFLVLFSCWVVKPSWAGLVTEPETPTAELFPLTHAPDLDFAAVRTERPTVQSEQRWHDLRTKVLNDFASRIAPEFHVQDGLRRRTEFWFDVYTRYGEAHHLIHHGLYPWIVFRIVDTTEMVQNGKGPRWLRRERGEKFAEKQVRQIRAALNSLARRKDYSRLPALEYDLYNKLMPVPGSRRKVFLSAAQQIRSQLGQKDFFQNGLVNSSRYLPYMEEEFRRLELPVELTRMPFVESSFNEDARSKVGASGIWQIMPATGAQYMIVNEQIDERNSPLKATLTAGRLLQYYNRSLNSWPLTITSYNNGIGNIQKAIRSAGSRDLSEIIARYRRGDFRFSSSNFYTCFLAALYAEKYHELIFKEIPREPLLEREVVKLAGAAKITYVKKITGLTNKALLRYNPDLKYAVRANSRLPRGYRLHLPPGLGDRLLRQVGGKDIKPKPNT